MPYMGTVRVTYTINGVVQESGVDIPVDVDTEIENHANNYLFATYPKTIRDMGPLEDDEITEIKSTDGATFQIPPFKKTVDSVTYGATFSEPRFDQAGGARHRKRKTIRRKRSTRRMHKRHSSRRRKAI